MATSRRGVAPLRHAAMAVVVGAALTVGIPPVTPATAGVRAADAASLPAGFQEGVVFSGLTQPTAVRFANDGRVFVAEKSGLIKVFSGLSDSSPTVFADLRTQVHNFWDRGLLGLALDPAFPANPWVYVLYTRDATIGGAAPLWGSAGGTSDGCPTPPGPTSDGCVVSGRLSRLQASGDLMVGTEQVLIEDWCQQYPSHSVGSLAFGSDGALYVSGGDGASFGFGDWGQAGAPTNPCGDPPALVGGTQTPPTAEGGALRSQDVRTTADATGLSGTILRVDPATGLGLPGNPFEGSADINSRRIVAYGLRNPFRITVRPGTTEVWAGDVGWSRWEELDRVANPTDSTADNLGWPCYEGDARQGGYDAANLNLCESLYAQGPGAVTAPYFRYHHDELVVPNDPCPAGGSSVAGLSFYTGGSYPAEYRGALFFADYSRRCIWAVLPGPDGLPDLATRRTFVAGAAEPVDVQIGPGGDLFYVDLGGTIRRIRYFAQNQPPIAVATAQPTSGQVPLTVSFDGTGSSDPDGASISYAWDLDGDDAFDDSTAATPSFTYTSEGTSVARLRVSDEEGAAGFSSVTITAGNTPPRPVINTPLGTTNWKVGDTITFSGLADDDQDGTLPASTLTWSLILRHCSSTCHEHPLQTFTGTAGGSFVAPDHEYPAHLELRLTATDAGGLASTTSVRLDPQTVQLNLASQPTGLTLAVGSTSQATPFSRTAIRGSTVSLSAPPRQSLGTETYQFSSWSDGGAASHTTAVDASRTFTAAYTRLPVVVPGGAGIVEGNAGTKVLQLPVSLSVPSAVPVTVQWSTIDGPGQVDYDPASGTVTFAPGETAKTVPVTVRGDTIDEANEWLAVVFSNATNATIGGYYGIGFGVILDDDLPPLVRPGTVGISPEGDSGSTSWNLPVTLSSPSGFPVTVDWSTIDTASAGLATSGADFVTASGTVTFQPGETVKNISLEILGDTVDEPPLLWGEWGLVAFTNPTHATLDTSGFYGLGLFIIVDDDP